MLPPAAVVGVVTRPLPRLRLVDRPLVLKDRLDPSTNERQFVDGSRVFFRGPPLGLPNQSLNFYGLLALASEMDTVVSQAARGEAE